MDGPRVALVNLVPLSADEVYSSGVIDTAGLEDRRAEAIGVRAARIVFVGSNTEAVRLIHSHTRVVELERGIVARLAAR